MRIKIDYWSLSGLVIDMTLLISVFIVPDVFGCPPPPVEPPCGWYGCGNCMTCTPGGCVPKCTGCTYCKQATGACLNSCHCGQPCIEIPYYPGHVCGDDTCGDNRTCCVYGPPDYQEDQCCDVNCEYCSYISGCQPVTITSVDYMKLYDLPNCLFFWATTIPPGRDEDVVWSVVAGDGVGQRCDMTGNGDWGFCVCFDTCYGEKAVKAQLCASSVEIPVTVCDSSMCERCNLSTGLCEECDPAFYCNGLCCDCTNCMDCNATAGSCEYRCNPSCCDSFDCQRCVQVLGSAVCAQCLRKVSYAELEHCNKVPDPTWTPQVNGCSVPDILCWIVGVDCDNPTGCEHTSFLGPCNTHDICYQTCGGTGGSGKSNCDYQFGNDMYSVCNALTGEERINCYDDCIWYQEAYVTAVGAKGWDAWITDQELACACCDCN